jgi:thioredoxin-like negative regulator of GroEL
MDTQLDAYLAGKRELHRILELTPEQVQALRGRAQFFVDGEHDERALIMLEMLEELDRTDPRPTLMAIDVLLRLGHSDAAKEKVEALAARHPGSADALTARAQLQIGMGEWANAAETLREVAKRDPSAKTDAGKRGRALAARAYAIFEANR